MKYITLQITFKEHRNLVPRPLLVPVREPRETRLRTWLRRYRTISRSSWGNTIFSVIGLSMQTLTKETDLWYNVRVFPSVEIVGIHT